MLLRKKAHGCPPFLSAQMKPTSLCGGTQGDLRHDPSKALENAQEITRYSGKQTMDFTVHTFWWKSVLSKSKSLSFH